MIRIKTDPNAWATLAVNIGFIFVLFLLTIQLATSAQPWTILDYANLPIHEAGHVLLSLFGDFMYYLGGSILQLLIPLLFLIYFVIKKQYFAAGFGIFWLGDNLVSIGTYMQDARLQSLHILGEVHDWNWLFTQMNILQYDLTIGGFFSVVGILCLFFALTIMIAYVAQRIQKKLRALASAV